MRTPMDIDGMFYRNGNGRRIRGRGRPLPGLGRGRPSAGGRMMRVPPRGPLGLNARPSSYTIAKSIRRARSFPWEADLLRESLRSAEIPGIDSGSKLYVCNLDYGVSNQDIRDLFSEIGELLRYAIHYDKSGRPTGSAEVVYVRRSDAVAAVKRYNNVQLDGKPMRIQIIDANSSPSVSARVNVVGRANGRNRRTVVMMSPSAPPRAPPSFNRISRRMTRGAPRNVRGRGGVGRGRGRGRGRREDVNKSVDELDKELDNYHAEATNT